MQKAEKSQTSRELSLEERVKRIIDSPVLELDGDAYKNGDKYQLNDWKSIENWMKENVLRKDFLNIDTNGTMQLTTKGMDKLIHHSSGNEIYQKSLFHIPEIIKNMKFLEKEGNEKLNKKFDSYEYFLTLVKMDGKSYTILSIVGKKNRSFYYDQSVMEGSLKDVVESANNQDLYKGKCSRLYKILEGQVL